MKKPIQISLILAVALTFSFQAEASKVSVQTAQTAALNFFTLNSTHVNNKSGLVSALKYTQTETDNTVDFYVFDINGTNGVKGFVIISGDNNLVPVIGYSFENNFNTNFQHAGIKSWVNHASSYIYNAIQRGSQADAHISGLWAAYASGQKPASDKSLPVVVSPLLTTAWDQEPNYNQYCPFNTSDSLRTVTGCVATAMAQIMKFWNYPAQGTGAYGYNDEQPNFLNNLGVQYANFGATTYQWDSMPASISGNNNTIATLMYHCGVAVAMDYGDDNQGGSAGYVLESDAPSWGHSAQSAYQNYFAYNSATIQGVHSSDYSSADWINLLKGELNAGRPIQYEGVDPAEGGHTWVCDGYDANGMFHMNWGWSGQDDGYFSVTNLSVDGFNFSSNEAALIGIEPIVSFNVQVVSSDSIICSGARTTLSATGPVNASYTWSPVEGLACPTCVSTQASPASTTTYTLVVDSAGFTATSTLTINVRTAISIVSGPVSAVSCYGGANGALSVSVSGGTPVYTYRWNNGDQNFFISHLVAGKYTLSVSDATGCSASASQTVSQPDTLILSITATNAACYLLYGSAVANVTGGTGNFSFLWNNGQNTSSASNLSAGDYSVTVTDAAGCTSAASQTVTQPDSMNVSIVATTTNTKVYGNAEVKVTGGTPNYSFVWNNGQQGPVLEAAFGDYTVTVTDNNGCQKTAQASISETTGVGELSQRPSFNVYPNPAINQVSIALDYPDDATIITVKNALGQTLLTRSASSTETQLDISSFAAGVYFVELIQNGKTNTKAIVKK